MLYIQQNHADINQNSVLFYYAAAQILFLYVPFYILLSAVSSSASKKQKKTKLRIFCIFWQSRIIFDSVRVIILTHYDSWQAQQNNNNNDNRKKNTRQNKIKLFVNSNSIKIQKLKCVYECVCDCISFLLSIQMPENHDQRLKDNNHQKKVWL